jgi:cellulose synthase/poly-beta-1,6-N-acetylglucosamine synthase-like glycosyltransferase
VRHPAAGRGRARGRRRAAAGRGRARGTRRPAVGTGRARGARRHRGGVGALEALFWGSVTLIAFTHAGYPALLLLLDRVRRARDGAPAVAGSRPGARSDPESPLVSLVIAAHDEEEVIGRRVENALAAEYPRKRIEVIVASDGSTDRTVERARAAGADLVLSLPRGGKVNAQDRAVESARGEVLAFSDANSMWAPDALRHLVNALADPEVGYVCGTVRFHARGRGNEEGVYWRLENGVRALESRLASITAGNGAIYAVRRSAYMRLDRRTSHDLSFPFNMVKRGWRAIYEPRARADEEMATTLEGEFRRKRRMMRHAWPTVLSGGLLSPRGYGALYALEIFSHRLLRYLTPGLHLFALATSAVLARRRRVYAAALAAQLLLVGAAAAAPRLSARPLRLARYYVLVTAAIGAGLWDHLRVGTPAWWEREEGTR